ncbi:hypothetical protein [Rhodococcus sp. OK519]
MASGHIHSTPRGLKMGSFSTISAVIDIVKTVLPLIQQLGAMS